MMKRMKLMALLMFALVIQSVQADNKKFDTAKQIARKVGKVSFYGALTVAGWRCMQQDASPPRPNPAYSGVARMYLVQKEDPRVKRAMVGAGGVSIMYGLLGLNRELNIIRNIKNGAKYGAKKFVEGVKSRKVRMVGWHAGELAAGLAMIFYHTPWSFMPLKDMGWSGYSDNHGETYDPSIDYARVPLHSGEIALSDSRLYWNRWREYVGEHPGYSAITTLFGITCCSSAIKGLNRELKISERANKLVDRIRNRKKQKA